jgi:hypothetical protein
MEASTNYKDALCVNSASRSTYIIHRQDQASSGRISHTLENAVAPLSIYLKMGFRCVIEARNNNINQHSVNWNLLSLL